MSMSRTLWIGATTKSSATRRCRLISGQACGFGLVGNEFWCAETLADFLWGAGYGQSGSNLRPKIAGARHHKLFDFYLLERFLAAEQMRDQGDLRKVLHGFHFHVGMFERV